MVMILSLSCTQSKGGGCEGLLFIERHGFWVRSTRVDMLLRISYGAFFYHRENSAISGFRNHFLKIFKCLHILVKLTFFILYCF